jgi:hypothetical protein
MPAKKPSSKYKSLLGWCKAVGLATACIGGIGMMQEPVFFWWAIGAIYFGVSLLGLDLWFEPWFQKWSRKAKIVSALIFLILLGIFTRVIVFVPAPLVVTATYSAAKYPDGSKIGEIMWRPEFGELLVRIANPTDRKYEDLNIVIRPNKAIARVSQLDGAAAATFETKGGLQIRQLLQSSTNLMNSLVLLATDAGYRLRCEKLPAHGDINFVMAVAEVKWNPSTNKPKPDGGIFDKDYTLKVNFTDGSSYWYGHEGGGGYNTVSAVEQVTIVGEYVAGQRIRHISASPNIINLTQIKF